MGTLMFVIGLLLYPAALYNTVQAGQLFAAKRYVWSVVMLVLGAVLCGFANSLTGLSSAVPLLGVLIGGAVGAGGVIWGMRIFKARVIAAAEALVMAEAEAQEAALRAQAQGEDEV